MTANKQAPVPRLRFPEFQDAPHWQTGRCRDIAKVLPGHGFPDKFQGNKKGQYPFYKVSDISHTIEKGQRFISEANNYIDSDVLDRIRGKSVPAGTTLFAKIGEAIRSNRRVITTKPAVIDNNTAGIKAMKANSSDEFLFYLWSNVSLIDHAGGVVPAVSKLALENVRLCYPCDLIEQQRIADCLGSLDDLIAGEGRKIEALRQHKQGLMQQLFPKSGETVPRLRFPEFRDAGEWGEKRLRDLGTLISGLTYSPKDVRDGGLLVLRSSNIQNGAIVLDDCVYVRRDMNGTNLTQPDDILICVRNGSRSLIGKNAIVPKGMPVCTHGAFMTVFRASAPHFARVLLQTTAYQKQVAADLGATINSINKAQLLKYRFTVPKPAEQQRIATCLSAVDTQISAQARRIVFLKQHKQGLLQHLIPSLEGIEQ